MEERERKRGRKELKNHAVAQKKMFLLSTPYSWISERVCRENGSQDEFCFQPQTESLRWVPNLVHFLFRLENLTHLEESLPTACMREDLDVRERPEIVKRMARLGKACRGHMFSQRVTCRHTPAPGQVTARSFPPPGQALVPGRPRTLPN